MTRVVPAVWRHETNRLRRNARGLRDRQAFERIPLQAGELFAAGRSQAKVARRLGVSRQNVSRWHARWRSGGSEALRSAGPTGHTYGIPIPPGAGLVRSAIEQVMPGLKRFTLQSRTNLG
jgi:hypothetical protein